VEIFRSGKIYISSFDIKMYHKNTVISYDKNKKRPFLIQVHLL